MENTELHEQLIIVASFIGAPETIKTNKGPKTLYFKPGHDTPHCELHELEYHTSWDWQIDPWSKACKEIDNICSNAGNKREWLLAHEYTLHKHHATATRLNQPEEGFKVLMEAIKWINEHKQNAS